MDTERNFCPKCGEKLSQGSKLCPLCTPFAVQSPKDVDEFVLAATRMPPREAPQPVQSPLAAFLQKHQTFVIIVSVLLLGCLLMLPGLLEVAGIKLPLASGSAPVVTMAEYDQLRNGMSYTKVTEIIGAPGKLAMTSDQMPFRAYTWRNEDLSSVTCQFINDRLTNREQTNLPETEQ